jgi:hypothetical protein
MEEELLRLKSAKGKKDSSKAESVVRVKKLLNRLRK